MRCLILLLFLWSMTAAAPAQSPPQSPSPTGGNLDDLQKMIDKGQADKLKKDGASTKASGDKTGTDVRSATLVVRSDDDCQLTVNGDDHGVLKANQVKKVKTPVGDQLVECRSIASPDVVASEVRKLEGGSQTVVMLKLKGRGAPAGEALIASAPSASNASNASSIALDPEHWIADAKGCKAHRSIPPKSNDSIQWDGQCLDGLVSGTGVLRWFRDGESWVVNRGTFSKGMPSGRMEFDNFKEHSSSFCSYSAEGEPEHCETTYSSGNLKSVSEDYEHGKVSRAKIEWTEGSVYEGGVDPAVADRWGRMVAQAGRPVPAIDSLLAATAAQHGLILVTRNLRDVQGTGVEVINPWSE